MHALRGPAVALRGPVAAYRGPVAALSGPVLALCGPIHVCPSWPPLVRAYRNPTCMPFLARLSPFVAPSLSYVARCYPQWP
eukprot:3227121-Pyramimonas_sp.AAC.1